MGQKVNPLGMRLGITRDWTSRWYAGKKQFPVHVHTDFRVREFLKDKLKEASVSRIMIERAAKKVNITIQTARPGIVIGTYAAVRVPQTVLRVALASILIVVAGNIASKELNLSTSTVAALVNNAGR